MKLFTYWYIFVYYCLFYYCSIIIFYHQYYSNT